MKIAILGAYQTKFGELWNKGLNDLLIEASLGAIKDAGIDKKEIDIVYIGNKLAAKLLDQNHLSALLSESIGIKAPSVRIEAACASGGMAVAQGCMAINSNQFQTALIVGVEKMTDLSTQEISSALMTAAGFDEQESGLSFVGLYALMAQKYLQTYQAKKEDLSCPAVKNHFHASLNNKAQYPFTLTLDQVEKSPVISNPLKLLHCSPITDGAAAVVLSSKKFAQKKKGNGIVISASTQSTDSLSLAKRTSLTQINSSKKASLNAYKMAGISPKDLSLLEVHDCFSIAEIVALEDLAVCKRGEAAYAERNGELKLGGKKPINVSGGLKACGHPVGATGVKQIVEAYNQLKRRAGKRQVKDAKTALTHNVGGIGGTAVVHILQK